MASSGNCLLAERKFTMLSFLLFFFVLAAASTAESIETNPTITSDNTPTISFNTDFNSICKGSLEVDKEYEKADFTFEGEETSHSYTFTSDLEFGSYPVYIKCMDDESVIHSYSSGFLLIQEKYNSMNVDQPGASENGDLNPALYVLVYDEDGNLIGNETLESTEEPSKLTGLITTSSGKAGLALIFAALIVIGLYAMFRRKGK